MRHVPGGLSQDKRQIRGGRKHSPPSPLFCQRVIIIIGIEAKQRKMETVLATRFAMASTSITAGFGQDRNDIIDKVELAIWIQMTNGHLDNASHRVGNRGLIQCYDERCTALFLWGKSTLMNSHDIRPPIFFLRRYIPG